MNTANRRAWLAAATGAVLTAPAAAQWAEQSFELRAGWNSVFLEVDPAPAEADALFGGHPIIAVWASIPSAPVEGPPDCLDPNDPACVPPLRSEWHVWVPPGDPKRVAINLRQIQGGQVYLIKATAPATWSVTGRPNGSRMHWRQGFNLAGFHVVQEATAAPTFATYLAPAAPLAAAAIYEIEPQGTLTRVVDPATTRITSGRGYWVSSSQSVEYTGPLRIDNGSLRGIDFGRALVERSTSFENLADSPADVTVANRSSVPVPSDPADLPTLAGDAPLSWAHYGGGYQTPYWHDLTVQGWPMSVAGATGAQVTVRLGFDRAGLPAAVLDADHQGAQYQDVLEVLDGRGFRRLLPVTGEVTPVAATSVAGAPSAHPGLYIGHVAINEVAWISAGARTLTNPCECRSGACIGGPVQGAACERDANCACPEPDLSTPLNCDGGDNDGRTCQTNGDCPDGSCVVDDDTAGLRPAAPEFTFPIIVHVSDTGVYTTLTEVTLMWEPGGDNPETPGRYVLVTPECPQAVLDALEFGCLQDGEPFGYRVSTIAFSFDGDLPLTGDFSTFLEGGYTLSADHPLNPFHHEYHPDHDCDQVGECYEIARTFRLTFAATPPPGLERPGWGDSLLAGTYTEMLDGLHKYPVDVRGRFELQRVSQIATLNAQ